MKSRGINYGKQYPSDELVNTIFNLFIKNGCPKYYNFPEYINFIDLAVNFEGMSEDYNIYDKCRLFSKIPQKQRRYILTKNEEYIKERIKEHTIDEDIFNLNYFDNELVFNEFFLNKKISNTEKKELISLHAIDLLTPIDSTIKRAKELSKEEILNWLELKPINNIYLYTEKWKNNKYLTSILKEHNEEIFNLAKRCEEYIDFCDSLFINYNYVSAYFNKFKGKFEILTGGIIFYNKLQDSEFWYEYNIPGEKRDFYSKVQKLHDGARKERELYYKIKSDKLNTWHDLENVSLQIENELQNVYPKEKILEILKKISEDKEIQEEEKQMFNEFFKGIYYIHCHHNSQTFIYPQQPYYSAIAETDEFKRSSYSSYYDVVGYLQQANMDLHCACHQS